MKTKIIPAKDWEWFGHAGHLIVASRCRFHLCTKVGHYLVSTVGEYWPDRVCREIHAGVYDPKWLAANRERKGDDFDHAYMAKFGFETIGAGKDSLYETMVFHLGSERCSDPKCDCGMPTPDKWGELDGRRYAKAGEATRGHYEYCEKWADLAQVRKSERAQSKGGE